MRWRPAFPKHVSHEPWTFGDYLLVALVGVCAIGCLGVIGLFIFA